MHQPDDRLADLASTAVARIGADSVYMLLHQGWRNEARANRWHFAKRWSRLLPVTLVVPERRWFGTRSLQEKRLPNCRILPVLPATQVKFAPEKRMAVQFSQILQDIQRNSYRRPILWLYNSDFVSSYAALPCVRRVHHATENYFDFDLTPDGYLDRLSEVIQLSDLNVAVSEGCAFPLRKIADPNRLMIVTNGCDYLEYSTPRTPMKKIADLKSAFGQVAVFAGGINNRLDFPLIFKLADRYPRTLLLFVGKAQLPRHLSGNFTKLCQRHNVRHIGPVNPDDLPSIYQAADLGFIPYVQDRWIAENGFPLKALEMAAAGLPVVSSFMRPLLVHTPPLTVTSSHEEFIKAFGQTSADEVQRRQLRCVAAANDYDNKFADIVEELATLEPLVSAPDMRGRSEIFRAAEFSNVLSRKSILRWQFCFHCLDTMLVVGGRPMGRVLGLLARIRRIILRARKIGAADKTH